MASQVRQTEAVNTSIEVWLTLDGQESRNLDLGFLKPKQKKDFTVRFRNAGTDIRNMSIKRMEQNKLVNLVCNRKNLTAGDCPVVSTNGGPLLSSGSWSERVPMTVEFLGDTPGRYELQLDIGYEAP